METPRAERAEDRRLPGGPPQGTAGALSGAPRPSGACGPEEAGLGLRRHDHHRDGELRGNAKAMLSGEMAVMSFAESLGGDREPDLPPRLDDPRLDPGGERRAELGLTDGMVRLLGGHRERRGSAGGSGTGTGGGVGGPRPGKELSTSGRGLSPPAQPTGRERSERGPKGSEQVQTRPYVRPEAINEMALRQGKSARPFSPRPLLPIFLVVVFVVPEVPPPCRRSPRSRRGSRDRALADREGRGISGRARSCAARGWSARHRFVLPFEGLDPEQQLRGPSLRIFPFPAR